MNKQELYEKLKTTDINSVTFTGNGQMFFVDADSGSSETFTPAERKAFLHAMKEAAMEYLLYRHLIGPAEKVTMEEDEDEQ